MSAGKQGVSLIYGEQQLPLNQHARTHRMTVTLIDTRRISGNFESNRNLPGLLNPDGACTKARSSVFDTSFNGALITASGVKRDALTINCSSLHLRHSRHGWSN